MWLGDSDDNHNCDKEDSMVLCGAGSLNYVNPCAGDEDGDGHSDDDDLDKI